ncbi:hypothetical protein BaRGS_00024757 [Batillaria attramentaria]|uniref:Uncharacterized protein n=1 Tax=Batillaria attramentaria TaxID=370345 RepID=A0ABD0KAG6_9CAEN
MDFHRDSEPMVRPDSLQTVNEPLERVGDSDLMWSWGDHWAGDELSCRACVRTVVNRETGIRVVLQSLL